MARKGHWLASVAMTVLVSPENEEAQVSALQSGSQLSLTPEVWGGGRPILFLQALFLGTPND